MLVPFVIDADSLAPDPDWSSAQKRACHNNFLTVWQRVGLLVHDGKVLESSRFFGAVSKLPQSLRPLWQEVLERSPLLAADNGWDGTVSLANLASISAKARLSFVDDARAEIEFGIGDDCDDCIRTVNGVELCVCRILAASQARAFQAAIALSGAHIEAGDTYQTTWDARFKMLAQAPIKRVSIVDRYAIGQHMQCPRIKLSGLERFLRLLDSTANGPRHLTVFSAWNSDLREHSIGDCEAELRLLFGRLPNKKIKRLKLNMVPNADFRDDGHDRFIRFEDYLWDLGLGLEVFDGPAAAKRSSASFKTYVAAAGYRRVEQDLANSPGIKSCEIP